MRGVARSIDRAVLRAVNTYMWSVSSRPWLNLTVGVFFFALAILIGFVFLTEAGRATGIWIPSWDTPYNRDPNMPRWLDLIGLSAVSMILMMRSYYFFKFLNGYKKR